MKLRYLVKLLDEYDTLTEVNDNNYKEVVMNNANSYTYPSLVEKHKKSSDALIKLLDTDIL